MNKRAILLALLVSGAAVTTNAQTEAVTNDPEATVTMTPEADDWAISIDAVPFLDYFGNMFNSGGNTAPTIGYANGIPWGVRGKMFVDENTAYRGGLRLGFGSTTLNAEYDDISDNGGTAPVWPAQAATVTETFKSGYNAIVLTGGMEMRKGKTRLQGYYGGEFLFGMAGSSEKYTYGNAMNTLDPFADPTAVQGWDCTDWSGSGGNNQVIDPTGTYDARVNSAKTSSMTIGLRGFIGAEYFILPKISLGGEFGWGLGYVSSKTVTDMSAMGDPVTAGTFIQGDFTTETKTSQFALDTDIMNSATGLLGAQGQINLTFHF